jgi:hypothetical protein
MAKCLCTVALLGLLLCGRALGQEETAPRPFSLGIMCTLCVPMADSASYFGLGGGEEVSLRYEVPGTIIVASGGIGYALTPGQRTARTMVIAAAELGLGVRYPVTSFLGLFLYGTGGVWYGAFYDMSVTSADPYAGIGLELQLALSPILSLDLGAQYKVCFGLWQGLVAGLGMRIDL